MQVEVHPLTNDPNSAWKEISQKQRILKLTLKPLKPYAEMPRDKVRIVCMSDTHSLTHKFEFDVPDGDIFIHAGDFTSFGKIEEVIQFNEWIGKRYFLIITITGMIAVDRIDLQARYLISTN